MRVVVVWALLYAALALGTGTAAWAVVARGPGSPWSWRVAVGPATYLSRYPLPTPLPAHVWLGDVMFAVLCAAAATVFVALTLLWT